MITAIIISGAVFFIIAMYAAWHTGYTSGYIDGSKDKREAMTSLIRTQMIRADQLQSLSISQREQIDALNERVKEMEIIG